MGRVTITPEALAALRSLPPAPKKTIRLAIDALQSDARPRGYEWKRLETSTTSDLVFRLRVGSYRVAYVLRGTDVRVVRVFHRDEGYRWLARLGY